MQYNPRMLIWNSDTYQGHIDDIKRKIENSEKILTGFNRRRNLCYTDLHVKHCISAFIISAGSPIKFAIALEAFGYIPDIKALIFNKYALDSVSKIATQYHSESNRNIANTLDETNPALGMAQIFESNIGAYQTTMERLRFDPFLSSNEHYNIRHRIVNCDQALIVVEAAIEHYENLAEA